MAVVATPEGHIICAKEIILRDTDDLCRLVSYEDGLRTLIRREYMLDYIRRMTVIKFSQYTIVGIFR